ncbi:MAG: FHA domain-containing protein [Polyangiaceae bacterium]
MWKLTIEDDEGQRTSLDLTLAEYTVGRAEDNDIRLTERNISRRHAIFRHAGGGWEIVDSGSYNGSYVNGERVTTEGRPLQAGDIINLGDYRVELRDEAAQRAEEAATRQRRPDRLICVIGPTPGSEHVLEGDRITLGRAEEAVICINHASVSRLHAEMHNLGQSRWEVVDQGSSNGLRINGVELRRGIIEPGDALELGDVRLRFVAAGKFYRPVVDMSQQLPALPFDGMASPAGVPASDRKIGTIAAVLAVCLALGFGAWAMFSPTTTTTPTSEAPPMATSDEQAKAYLDRAREYVGDGDIQKAHDILQAIPESSPVRESDEYLGIEDKWADFMFKKVDEAESAEEKRKLLNAISETTTVSAEKRQDAAERALAIAPDKAVPIRPTGVGIRPPEPGGQPPAPTPSPKTEPTTAKSTPKPAPDKFDPASVKPGLVAKMQSGTATAAELRMLISICSGDGDTGCRNQAFAAWKRKTGE